MSERKINVSVINRNEEDFTRERSNDHLKVFKNADPRLHPFQKAREYTRALNAVKMEKMFAKPFIYALDGHADGVYAMSRVANSLPLVLSGDGSGEVKLWHLGTQRNIWSANAHRGRVRGITTDPTGEFAFSCGTDKTIKMWEVGSSSSMTRNNTSSLIGAAASGDNEEEEEIDDSNRYSSASRKPVNVFLGKNNFSGIDHHRELSQFATSGVQVDLWDHERADPIHSFQWGADSVVSVKYNPVDVNVLLSTASDRSLVLYDVRAKAPLRKLIMYNVTNAVSWNPMESFGFVAASEDHNCYTFDMRKLDRAVIVHEDHGAAVMSVDFAPTGKEFVTGSYDRTVRIWSADAGRARDVYHTNRMQKVFSVLCSQDNRFALSGSDDTNIRMWKLRATEQLSQMAPRAVAARQYRDKLIDRFQHAPEIARIKRDQRHLPKSLVRARKEKRRERDAATKRDENKRKYTSDKEEKKGYKEERIVKVFK
jgi:WD repeat and SOF domain-containing protein 1